MNAIITATLSPEFIQEQFYCYFQYAGVVFVLLAVRCWRRRR